MSRGAVLGLLSLLMLFVTGGASCPRMIGRAPSYAGPVVLVPGATLEQILAVVNEPGQRVQQLRSVGAKLEVNEFPQLAAELALERPRRFHLTAKLSVALSGEPEVDLGSNDQIYWMLLRREEVMYVGRHDQPLRGEANQFLPVPPDWLTEVLGLIALTPQDILAGPIPTHGNQVSLQTRVTGRPDLLRVLQIDAQRGLVLEQHLYSGNRLIASAKASQHRWQPEYGVALPHRIEVHLPLISARMQLDSSLFLINQLPSDSTQLWQMPQSPSVEQIELTSRAGPTPDRLDGRATPAQSARLDPLPVHSAQLDYRPEATYQASRTAPAALSSGGWRTPAPQNRTPVSTPNLAIDRLPSPQRRP